MAVITGDWVRAVNQASHATGSIHDEDRARELGFSAAVIGAGMHIPLVTKAAVALFDRDWYERGFLKARFDEPMHEGDEIRCVLEDIPAEDGDARLLAMRIEKADGSMPMTGFLGLLKDSARVVAPWQRHGEAASVTHGEYDPLPNDAIGTTYPPKAMTFEPERLRSLELVGDPCPWYEGASPWGPSILPTYRFVRLPRLASDLRPDGEAALDMQSSMNALFQIVHLGPALLASPYSVQSTLVEKGYSGRTAFRTCEAVVRDGDKPLALVRQMLRWVPQRALIGTA
jgi:hypothetical protein